MNKKIASIFVITLVMSFLSTFLFAQDLLPTQEPNTRWRLFLTQNPYIFLQLDTQTGAVYLLNTMGDFSRTEIVKSLSRAMEDGTYTLYPTRDNLAFILLEQKRGGSYLVHWDTNISKCYYKELGKNISEDIW